MKILAIAAMPVLVASQAFAGSYEVRCKTTSVPYQETVKGGKPENVIGGAIVGGVIGKVVTKKMPALPPGRSLAEPLPMKPVDGRSPDTRSRNLHRTCSFRARHG